MTIMDEKEKLQDVASELDEIIEILNDALLERDKIIAAEIAAIYPQFRPENYARAPKDDDPRYEKLDPHSTPIKKNDIITASTLTVMAAGEHLEDISKSLENILSSSCSTERINGYLETVHKTVQHLYSRLSLGEELKVRCWEVYDDMVKNKIVPLGDILARSAPTTCFGQAVCLAFLINNDSFLYSQGKSL